MILVQARKGLRWNRLIDIVNRAMKGAGNPFTSRNRGFRKPAELWGGALSGSYIDDSRPG
jgi:hypothetical protein